MTETDFDTDEKKHYDHSQPSARFLVLIGLFSAGGDAGLDEIEKDPHSILAAAYLLMPTATLVVVLVSLTVARGRRRRTAEAAPADARAVGVTGEASVPPSSPGPSRVAQGGGA